MARETAKDKQDKIVVKGAREHNLQDITVEIPRNRLVVITGLSGSGKSTLAFDTLYAEGQRRYVESLSAYARQFIGLMEKPDVDSIEGLSPAISIEQKTASRNPRSTVGTITEIYDYLRLLFARIGIPHCPECGKRIKKQSSSQIVDLIMDSPPGSRIQVYAPLVRGRKGEHKDVLGKLGRMGFVRVRVDGKIYEVGTVPALDKKKKHEVSVLVDRVKVEEKSRPRIADSVETALRAASGIVVVETDGKEELYSEQLACPDCGTSLGEVEPRLFSFNSPYGACPECSGLGTRRDIAPELIVPDPALSLIGGAVKPWGVPRGTLRTSVLPALAEKYGFDLATPWRKLPEKVRRLLLCGTGGEEIVYRFETRHGRGEHAGTFEGVIAMLERRFEETGSDSVRAQVEEFMMERTCRSCGGTRLKKESLAVKLAGKSIAEVVGMNVKEALGYFEGLSLTPREEEIARLVVKEIKDRLHFMMNVGLEYLTLERSAVTLSGGEGQRIRLATQIGSSLSGVLYILDEPSIGLHYRDNRRLLDTLSRLRDLGNTVIVVEHDEETILSADHVIDLGPGAGRHGGRLIAEGPPARIMETAASLTGQYLRGLRTIDVPAERRVGNGKHLTVKGARAHNLKSIDVAIPLGLFVCITGVSGSGKSTLVNDVLYRILARHFYRSKVEPGPYAGIEGLKHIDKVVEIDQSPIGRTPRSNPATYTGVFTPIRHLYSGLPEARMRGYREGRFSFNVKGGRCESCKGDGLIKVEMHFLPDVYVPCDICRGKRYNRETIEITYKGKSISDVLEMTVEEALEFFANVPQVKSKLEVLTDVGLGYIHLGQSATTLSGGEAQRVKLGTELAKRGTGRTLYILDEPTTGLHFEDVKHLLVVLHRLVDKGNTVLVIEHNLEVVKTADYLIDLGPEGGDLGGWIVAEGTPEEVSLVESSFTGTYLKRVLEKARGREGGAESPRQT
jgi:excinuclease ABC subunit A